jgi:DNA-binding transcriptional LysR family regulator
VAKIADWDDHVGRRLRLRDLRVFFAVVQSGSLTKAAKQLRVSHPAVSKVIAGLEHTLGVKLFDRSARGVEPTLYARALLARGRTAFDELREGIRDIEFLADPTAGELTIGYTLSDTVLPRIVEEFSEKHPRVRMQANIVPTPSFKFPGLRDRTYDLILTRIPTPVPDDAVNDLNVEVLFDDQLAIVACMKSRWARCRKLDLAELVDEPWLLSQRDTPSYGVVADAFKARGLGMPSATLVSYSMELRAKLAARGRFITIVPRSLLRLGDWPALQELAVDLPMRPLPVGILTLKNRTLSPVVERFIECARHIGRSMVTKNSRRKR